MRQLDLFGKSNSNQSAILYLFPSARRANVLRRLATSIATEHCNHKWLRRNAIADLRSELRFLNVDEFGIECEVVRFERALDLELVRQVFSPMHALLSASNGVDCDKTDERDV